PRCGKRKYSAMTIAKKPQKMKLLKTMLRALRGSLGAAHQTLATAVRRRGAGPPSASRKIGCEISAELPSGIWTEVDRIKKRLVIHERQLTIVEHFDAERLGGGE